MTARTAALVVLASTLTSSAQTPARWKSHDMNRTPPPTVQSSLQLPVPAPSDAIVLFDGKDLSNWTDAQGGPSKWIVGDGYMESVKGAGYIYSKASYGDIQLHIEWRAPLPVMGKSQGRGNSGVFLMGHYEIQVLDSHDNRTYADGQAGSLYGQYPPLVNAARPPGEWQSFDIVFRGPRFRRDGSVEKPARFTVFHNGVLVQDNVEAWGPTSWLKNYEYKFHPSKMPLAFQDHGNPVRYRNIWLRELGEWTRPGPVSDDTKPLVNLSEATLDSYTGVYASENGFPLVTIRRDGKLMYGSFGALPPIELLVHSTTEFSLRWTGAHLEFELDSKGRPTATTFHIGGEARRGKKK